MTVLCFTRISYWLSLKKMNRSLALRCTLHKTGLLAKLGMFVVWLYSWFCLARWVYAMGLLLAWHCLFLNLIARPKMGRGWN